MCRTAQPARLDAALEAILDLGSEWAAVRDALKDGRRWAYMREFAVSPKFLRAHEAAALNARAKKALVCVEEVAVHSGA